LKDLEKEKNKSRSLSKFYWLSSALQNRYILPNFPAFSASKLFLMLDHTKQYVEKYSVDAQLARHAHKLDVKLQRLCGSGFSVCCAYACQVLPVWSELTKKNCENKDEVHFFILKFECHNTYNKFSLCNSENGDIALMQ